MRAVKWVLIIATGLFLLVVAALLIIPKFMDLQRYKPHLEKKVSEATGRSFRIGGELQLSLFPWAGLAFSDLHMGNPPGFQEKDFLSVRAFEARVKLLPLLSKDIQVKRFILEGPRIALEKRADGKGNWEELGGPSEEVPSRPPEAAKAASADKQGQGLPIKDIAIGELAMTDGSVLWIDHSKGERREITGLNLRLEDVSLDRPVHVAFSATLDGLPLSLEGNVGPLGKDPGKGTIPLDLSLKAGTELDMNLKGNLVDPATQPQFDIAFGTDPFSARKLFAALGQAFPVETADPKALSAVAFSANLKGDQENVSLSGGILDLDESKLAFSAKAKAFSKPDVTFEVNLDEIDLDRYLPPSAKQETQEIEKQAEPSQPLPQPTDYTPLRRLVLNGSIHIGKLKAYGASLEDLNLEVSGKDGEFRLEPLTLKLYGGNVSATGAVNVGQDVPKTRVSLDAGGIQAGPLLRDVLGNDRLEGGLRAKVTISMAGDDPQGIKKTLNGNGDFLFENGAVKGIDLEAMVRNAKAAFGLAEKGSGGPRTDFSEFHIPFTIIKGVVNTSNTTLVSPALRVLAAGTADLVREALDFRIEPKFVATVKGQGDAMERSGFTVPVLVTGSFDAPKFRPDLEGMIRKGLEEKLPQASDLIKILPGQTKQEGDSGSLEDKAEDLLKQIPFGR